MKYKIYCIADIHFGKKDDIRLFNELQKFVEDIKKDKDANAIIICGDLFDRVVRMNEQASRLCINFVHMLNDISKERNVPFRILKGTKTHDFNQLVNFKALERNNINFRVIDTCQEEMLFADFSVLYIPEEYMNDSEEYYKDYFNKNYDAIFGHATFEFSGYTHGEDCTERPIKSAPTFNSKIMSTITRVGIFGHIHGRCSSNDIYYCGSYSRFGFGEPDDKGYIILTIDDKEYSVKYVNNELAPSYLSVYLEDIPGEDMVAKMQYIEELKNKVDFLRVLARNTSESDVTLMKQVMKNSDVKIEVKKKVETKKVQEEYQFIIERTMSEEETIQKFVEIKHGVTMNLDFIKNILSTSI